jgi:hypothetical protein
MRNRSLPFSRQDKPKASGSPTPFPWRRRCWLCLTRPVALACEPQPKPTARVFPGDRSARGSPPNSKFSDSNSVPRARSINGEHCRCHPIPRGNTSCPNRILRGRTMNTNFTRPT